jgi:hypothetical protein
MLRRAASNLLSIRVRELSLGEPLEQRDRDMKNIFFVSFFVVVMSSTAFASIQKLKVPRLKTVGSAIQHLVLAQTAPEVVERRGGFTILRKYYIAKWGSERFEYGMAQYQCRSSFCEALGEAVALKYFKSCKGFKKNSQPSCKNLESARIDVTDPYSEHMQGQDKREWYTCEDYGSHCSDRDEFNEFPSRGNNNNNVLPIGI